MKGVKDSLRELVLEAFKELGPELGGARLDKPSTQRQTRPMSDDVDLKVQLSEAKTDTKFAQVMGELARINTRLDGLERSVTGIKPTVITTGVVTAIAIIGVTATIMAYGQSWFTTGLTVRDVIKAEISTYEQQHPSKP